MNAADRRMEIISALMRRHHSTAAELAWEFGVCTRTITHDISRLSYGYPVYTLLFPLCRAAAITHQHQAAALILCYFL